MPKPMLVLMRLSPARERMLLKDPELLPELLAARQETTIPGLLELDSVYIELQRVLYDAASEASEHESAAEVLTPRGSLLLLESEKIDAARLVRAPEARRLAEWTLGVSPETVERLAQEPPRSPAALRYPESLGAVPTDDRVSVRTGVMRFRLPARPRDPAELVKKYEQVQALYRELLAEGSALLSARWRE